MLHNANNLYIFAIADRIGFGFDGTVQIMIEQKFVIGDFPQQIHHVLFQILLIDNDFHALTTQDVGWAHQNREIQFVGKFQCFISGGRHTKFGIGDIIFL